MKKVVNKKVTKNKTPTKAPDSTINDLLVVMEKWRSDLFGVLGDFKSNTEDNFRKLETKTDTIQRDVNILKISTNVLEKDLNEIKNSYSELKDTQDFIKDYLINNLEPRVEKVEDIVYNK